MNNVAVALETPEPGHGLLRVGGLVATTGPWSVAVRANDNPIKYLTADGNWQETPAWHEVKLVADQHPDQTNDRKGPGTLIFAVGTALVDGIAARGNGPMFQVLLRQGSDVTAVGRLQDTSNLLPSAAAALPADHVATAPDTVPVPAPLEPASEAPATEPAPTATPEPAPTEPAVSDPRPPEPVSAPAEPATPTAAPPSPAPTPRRRWLLVTLLTGAVAVPGAAAVWWYWPTPPQTPPISPETEASGTDTAPATPPLITPTPWLAGRARAQAFLTAHPKPAAVFDEASKAAADGDCDAALRLFHQAAFKDPVQAGRLARLQDSEGFIPSPCVLNPSPDSAQVNYQLAAEAGDPHAQRRLGELLVEQYQSGPNRAAGLDWLRKAAAAGNADAAARLQLLATTPR